MELAFLETISEWKGKTRNISYPRLMCQFQLGKLFMNNLLKMKVNFDKHINN